MLLVSLANSSLFGSNSAPTANESIAKEKEHTILKEMRTKIKPDALSECCPESRQEIGKEFPFQGN